jgi:hypothetical protein
VPPRSASSNPPPLKPKRPTRAIKKAARLIDKGKGKEVKGEGNNSEDHFRLG